ncbi:MFS transporter [Chachezhania sediminis]|uniref:MFS transporter n=1 Tax=Chachezhania sediminis TaxID=2599291 RepID=UPI00131BB17B|nr:MFS transporter [Chachezhania sediminis]
MALSDRAKTILSGAAGNVVEWFDFAIYGYLATIIGHNFFPSEDPFVSTVAAFGTFAAGYLMRPVGGAVFGYIGDRWGEKVVLIWSVVMMGGASGLIAILPTYDTAGYFASIGLVVLRMIQGFSVGGEFTGSIVYLVKSARTSQRGIVGATANTGAIIGFLIGSGVAAVLTTTLTQAEMAAWGWRLPFAIGVLIAALAFLMRSGGLNSAENIENEITEEALSEEDLAEENVPIMVALKHHWTVILKFLPLVAAANIAFYAMFTFAVDFMSSHYHVKESLVLDINTLNMGMMALFTIVAGWLADKLGRKPVLLLTYGSLALFSLPLSWLMFHTNPMLIFLGQLGFAAICGFGLGVNPVMLVEWAPKRARNTVISIGYNITLAVFGGTTPMVATWLIKEFKSPLSPIVYLVTFGAVAFVIALFSKESRGKHL